jgi:hypothetical protein
VEATLSFQIKKTVVVCLAMGFIVVCNSCGGSNSANTPPLSIQLSPAAPALAVNSSIFISAKTTPSLPEYYSTMTWSIQGYPTQTDCTEAVPDAQEAPAMSDCPNGWLAWEPPLAGYTQTGVYYYGPAAPGTYQVLVQGAIADPLTSQSFQGNASATVTVAQ